MTNIKPDRKLIRGFLVDLKQDFHTSDWRLEIIIRGFSENDIKKYLSIKVGQFDIGTIEKFIFQSIQLNKITQKRL